MVTQIRIENINSLAVPELIDLLVVNTQELLELNKKDADRYLVHYKKSYVEMLQSAITQKMQPGTFENQLLTDLVI